jgi:DNA polymerase-3 subunit delta'
MTGTSQANWPIIGHREAVDLFRRSVGDGRVGHAYLISGPEGVGRRTLARTFARALVCTAPIDERPCGVCSACRRVERGIHPDVTTVSLQDQEAGDTKGERKNTRISIETVRELRSSIALRPLEAPWRVAIVEDADRFSRDAYDALLKTLEEPPPFVVLLLIATELEALPETIRSRCRPVTLEPLRREDVAAALVERGVAPDLATTVASVTRGRIGQAIALARDAAALAERRSGVEAALEMIESPLAALGGARRLAEQYRRGQRVKVESQLDTLLGVWRDLALLVSGCPEQVVNADVLDRLERLAGRWSLAEVQTALKATYDALGDLAINVQPRLALDRMVTQWPRPDRL